MMTLSTCSNDFGFTEPFTAGLPAYHSTQCSADDRARGQSNASPAPRQDAQDGGSCSARGVARDPQAQVAAIAEAEMAAAAGATDVLLAYPLPDRI